MWFNLPIDNRVYLEGLFKMFKEKFERTKPHVNVGTIGHVDHGKNNFNSSNHNRIIKHYGGAARAFDRIDNAPEEKRVVSQSTPHTLNTILQLVTTHTLTAQDTRDYVKNMITGAAQMDGAILVVSSDRWSHATNSGAHLIRVAK